MDYLSLANSSALYLVVGGVLLFIAGSCMFFIIKFYRAGIKLGMDRADLKRTITSSALFTLLPAVSILLGVIALSGSLGVPTSWLRLSVVGNLSYEAIAAEAAAQGMGVELNSSVLTTENLVTILAVMTGGICWGVLLTIFLCPFYSRKCNKVLNAPAKKNGGKGFANWAMVSMFIGFCGNFIGSYIAQAVKGMTFIPLNSAVFAGLTMAVCMYFEKKGHKWLENFSLSVSMLVGMASAIIFS